MMEDDVKARATQGKIKIFFLGSRNFSVEKIFVNQIPPCPRKDVLVEFSAIVCYIQIRKECGVVEYFLSFGSSLWPYIFKYGIFLAPLIHVPMMTMRTIFVARGMKWVAGLCAYFEILIWFFAARRLFTGPDDFINNFLYPAFFACGVVIGIIMEEKLSLGIVIVRTIVQQNADQLIKNISDAGFGVTQTRVDGAFGSGVLLLSIVQRKHEERLKEIIEKFNPMIPYWTEDVRSINATLSLFWKSSHRGWQSIVPGMS